MPDFKDSSLDTLIIDLDLFFRVKALQMKSVTAENDHCLSRRGRSKSSHSDVLDL